MPLYHLTSDNLRRIDRTTFAAEGLKERSDLQRLLKSHIDVIAPGTLVIAEEFGHWEGSDRRIDLLSLDPDGTLVVIELKRTEDGGHMELQSLRYAAMISTMTRDQAVEAYSDYLANERREESARERIDGHLNEDAVFGKNVRILLVSAGFSKELTTSVLWLNQRHDLDIRCVRLQLHKLGENLIASIEQIIPLPEAAEYMIRVRKLEEEREAEVESANARGAFYIAYWTSFRDFVKDRSRTLTCNKPQGEYWIDLSPLGPGMRLRAVASRRDKYNMVEFVISNDPAKIKFEKLSAFREQIEGLTGALVWNRKDGAKESSVGLRIDWPDPDDESDWPNQHKWLLEVLERFYEAFNPVVKDIF